jgi:hypothetical protein
VNRLKVGFVFWIANKPEACLPESGRSEVTNKKRTASLVGLVEQKGKNGEFDLFSPRKFMRSKFR